MTRHLPPVVAGLLTIVLAHGSRADGPPSDRPSASCGMYALYHLARLEGVGVPADRIATVLPPLHPDGYSMKDLRDAAGRLGLGLQGVSLGREPGAIDRPMLAFLKLSDHGHYVVVRPVGHTGRLVQVIENAGDPLVVDSSMLFASPRWTGTVLLPHRTNWPVVLSSALIGLVGLSLVRRFRARIVGWSTTGLASGL